MEDTIREEWKNEIIPEFDGKEEFVDYLSQLFISNQLKGNLTDYIQPYVETKFKHLDARWAIVIHKIKENYKFFRLLNWTETDYIRCLSLCIILNRKLSRAELQNIYNDYKAGFYDNYFSEGVEMDD